MAENNNPGGTSQTKDAVAVVKQFLTHTVDKPDEEKAKALLSAETQASGAFHLTPEMFGAQYTVGEPYVENDQLWIPVEITSTDEDGASQTMTLPMAPVQEQGQWKLDMAQTFDKVMGGMDEVVEQMAQTVGKVMEGVGEAIAAGLEGVGLSSSDDAARPIDPEALERFQREVVRPIEQQIRDRIDADLPFDVDFPCLLTGSDQDENRRLLDVLRDRVFSIWLYCLREVNEKIPLQDRVKVVRLEGVADPAERAIFAEGARIIYRLNLADEDGFYDSSDLRSNLAGVVAGMAEVAPPGDALGRGPSYRPSGDVSQIVANYEEFVLPALKVRIAEMMGHELTIDIDWDLFSSNCDDVAGLWLWGVNRVCGAIGLLMSIPEIRDMRDEWSGSLNSVRIVPMPTPEVKAVHMEGDVLNLFIAPAAGEAGCFYEVDIADAINKGLKLRLRPVIAELERYAKTWDASLQNIFGRPIRFAFDFDTFAGHPDENKSLFALSMLREHGIDALYYALTRVAEKNPNFKQQVPKRVAWLYLNSVPTPEDKGVHGEQTTIVNHLFLFEGYNGYLTIKELEARLPGIVASMPDQDWDTPAATEPASETPEEPTVEEESEPTLEETEAQVFADIRSQIEATLPAYANQLLLMIGKAIPFEIEWESLGKKVEALGQLLNAALSPVLGGLSMLSQDAVARAAVAKRVAKILLKESDTTASHGFSLDDDTLVFAAVLSPTVPTMDPQTAANILRCLLTASPAKSAVKTTGPQKSRSKSKPKPKPTTKSKVKTGKSSLSKAAKSKKTVSKKAASKRPATKKKPVAKRKRK